MSELQLARFLATLGFKFLVDLAARAYLLRDKRGKETSYDFGKTPETAASCRRTIQYDALKADMAATAPNAG
jgi:hypothetical protein